MTFSMPYAPSLFPGRLDHPIEFSQRGDVSGFLALADAVNTIRIKETLV
jgi:hypothetical protein